MSEKTEYKKLSITELQLNDEDLQIPMTLAVVMSGTWLELLSLKNYFNKLKAFRVIYNTISSERLRIVNIEDYEAFQEWKKNQIREKEKE